MITQETVKSFIASLREFSESEGLDPDHFMFEVIQHEQYFFVEVTNIRLSDDCSAIIGDVEIDGQPGTVEALFYYPDSYEREDFSLWRIYEK